MQTVTISQITENRQKLSALGVYRNHIAHDLRSPLTVISSCVESMRDGVLKPTPERLNTIHAEVQHLQRLVENLRSFPRPTPGN